MVWLSLLFLVSSPFAYAYTLTDILCMYYTVGCRSCWVKLGLFRVTFFFSSDPYSRPTSQVCTPTGSLLYGIWECTGWYRHLRVVCRFSVYCSLESSRTDTQADTFYVERRLSCTSLYLQIHFLKCTPSL